MSCVTRARHISSITEQTYGWYRRCSGTRRSQRRRSIRASARSACGMCTALRTLAPHLGNEAVVVRVASRCPIFHVAVFGTAVTGESLVGRRTSDARRTGALETTKRPGSAAQCLRCSPVRRVARGRYGCRSSGSDPARRRQSRVRLGNVRAGPIEMGALSFDRRKKFSV